MRDVKREVQARAARVQTPRQMGLAPVVSANTRLLVLGSFPGKVSLAEQRYYAHPQNQFWRIFEVLLPDSEHQLSQVCYQIRIDRLRHHGIGVWDVYASCRREGSLDADIEDAQLNDFAALSLAQVPIEVIAFNGGESHRHHASVAAAFETAGRRVPQMMRLPSTSPANASWSFARKVSAWRECLDRAGIASAVAR